MRVSSAVVALFALSAAVACTSSAMPAHHVGVTVSPATSLLDQPVHIRVVGLKRSQRVTVRLHVRDARGRLWHSGATFRADTDGRLDIDRAKALGGAYRGVWGRGLLSMLTAPSPPTGTYFAWSTKGPERFTADVLVRGGEVASRSFRRGIPTGIVEQKLSVADDGVYGRYWARRDARAMHSPAVLMFGGADGGLRVGPRGEMLAAHGYSTLAIAYFKEPGLPKTLRSIPLEYFRRALEWLARRPGVDPRRIAVIGVSRGGEAAQLLGVHYPDLVDGVVAASTSNAALCSYPGCSGPAWTLGDEAVPYVNGLPVPETSGEGVIPDERIRGPLFLVCGGRDAIALSCAYERAIMRRLRDSQHPYADQLHAYRRADHYVGGLLPGLPIAPRLYLNAANERAREDLWPKLLTFLAKLPDQEEGGDHAGRRLL